MSRYFFLLIFLSSSLYASSRNCETIVQQIDLTTELTLYLDFLKNEQIISNDDLTSFYQQIENGNLVNPIPHQKSDYGIFFSKSIYRTPYQNLENYFKSNQIDLNQLKLWLEETIQNNSALKIAKLKTSEQTIDPYLKLNFHPVTSGKYNSQDFYLADAPITQWMYAFVLGESNFINYQFKNEIQQINVNGKTHSIIPDAPIEKTTPQDVKLFIKILNYWAHTKNNNLFRIIPGHLDGQFYRLASDSEFDQILAESDTIQNSTSESADLTQSQPLLLNGHNFYALRGQVSQISSSFSLRGGHHSQSVFHRSSTEGYSSIPATFRLAIERENIADDGLNFVDESKVTKIAFHPVKTKSFIMGKPDTDNLFTNMKKIMSKEEAEIVQATFTEHSFELQETLITQWMWIKVMNSNPASKRHQFPAIYQNEAKETFYLSPENPMENLSWNEIQAYVEKLNQLSISNSPLIYQVIPDHKIGDQFRLPYAKEMEFMYRLGGKLSGEFLPEPMRSNMEDYIWYETNAQKTTQPVKTKKPFIIQNKKFYDLIGNVRTMALDDHRPDGILQYGGGPLLNSGNNRKVYQGVSFDDINFYGPAFAVSRIFGVGPSVKMPAVGFRLVRLRN